MGAFLTLLGLSGLLKYFRQQFEAWESSGTKNAEVLGITLESSMIFEEMRTLLSYFYHKNLSQLNKMIFILFFTTLLSCSIHKNFKNVHDLALSKFFLFIILLGSS